jgi:hypothetical protein
MMSGGEGGMDLQGWSAVGLRTTMLALLLVGASAGASAADDAKAQADTLLRQIARAGADAQSLDRARVETLFGLRTSEKCGDFSDSQGHIYWCKDTSTEAQAGPIRFVAYETSRLGPGVMSGGRVSWEVDRARLCLKGAAIQEALSVKAEQARLPVMPDLLGFADPDRVGSLASYDFTLLRRPGEDRMARYRDNYVAVVEQGGCVDRFSLHTCAPPDE